MSDQKVIAALKDAENDIQKRLREVEIATENLEELTSVLNRVKFQRLLLQSLLLLYPSKSVSPNEQEMTEISKLLTRAGELMPGIKKSVERGTQPDLERKKKFFSLLDFL